MLGGIAVGKGEGRRGPGEGLPVKNREAIGKLAQSEEARRLMALLESQGGVREAAHAAAGGDASQLLAMVNRLMQTREGAELVDRIGDRAKQAGLE